MLRARTATLKRAFVLVRVGWRYFPHEKPQTPRYLDILAGRFLNIKYTNLWVVSGRLGHMLLCIYFHFLLYDYFGTNW